ncbi:MAG: (2Fe-2S)-binding protein, partial [Solirubrobacteraceae bacterium]
MESAAASTTTPAALSSAESMQPGTALSPRLYIDDALLGPEQELIFERTWQLAGHVSALARPGAYLTARAGSQPVLVVRDESG